MNSFATVSENNYNIKPGNSFDISDPIPIMMTSLSTPTISRIFANQIVNVWTPFKGNTIVMTQLYYYSH